MKAWLSSIALLCLSFWTAQALEVQLDQTEESRQKCAGMYSKAAWGGPVDPYIQVVFPAQSIDGETDPVVSLVIFEWKDEEYVGIQKENANPWDKEYICDTATVAKGYCEEADLGKFILTPNATDQSSALILTQAVHIRSPSELKYDIKKTGYYCVSSYGYSANEYMAAVEFREAYGELPATQIPKLPFYGGVTILYAVVVVFWGFLYYQHRYDILPVQNYITAILIFLVVEMLMTWGFYDYLNRHGTNVGSQVLLVVVAVLNAFRNSFSFFLLLIVCMGYGVVKPSLGKTMTYVRYLAIAHFVFGLVYAITSLVISPDTASPLVLLIVLPLAASLTAFYVWTLNSLNFTLKDLRERKQNVKEAMYKKLWWCILISIMVIFGFFFFNSFSFASATDPDFVPFHWKSRWFILDGWLNLVYFADVAWIAYIWRPTANNRRFAMSDEIAQDEDGGFEFADVGNPDDTDSDDDLEAGKPTSTQSANAVRSQGSAGAQGLQAPQQQQKNITPRDSFEDGETIFAVGEDGDKFSDDEDEDEDDEEDEHGEGSKLVKGKK
ncbi:lung seven transmembrane receptor-domain-containing protein [Xylariales sp. PMI_506]|nr:lung seven transmembrane receptor-domain-containing protein [Xylariales sp. PMI_506]